MRRVILRGLLVASAMAPAAFSSAGPASAAPAAETRARSGRPEVVLDRLTLPAGHDDARFRRFVTQVLRREARRADWGVGRGHRIEYRFTLDELEVREEGGVLRVRCEAVGRLPRGRSARSKLSYGGDIRERRRLVEHVVEVVARGVVARLAELERQRRGA